MVESDPNTIRILLTTDNHVGYKENDPIIGDDSWKTFHEITTIAKDHNVDMIVQGGDLFHVNKPSKKSLYHVIKSLRMNCMGDRPCELELLSDPSAVFDNGFDTVNYEDPNLNISIPVFAISGNHDDSSGEGLLLPLDVLSASGLVNHFGKVVNNEDIVVNPVLLQKGTTKLALYGMGNVRDERLARTFRDGHVKFLRPNVYTEEWFNLFTIHQNHVPHGKTAYIPEVFLPRFLDFVYWGHEHECMGQPILNPETGFDVLQAGSSVATSLSEGEVPDKHVYILNVKGKAYTIEPVKLKTIRPFVMKDIVLKWSNLLPGESSRADVTQYLVNETERLIEEANNKYIGSNKELFDQIDPELQHKYVPLPLIRIRVDYSGGYEFENAVRFSNRFVNRIANIGDVVSFIKKREPSAAAPVSKTKFMDNVGDDSSLVISNPPEAVLQELIDLFLKQTELAIIPENGIHNAVEKYIEQNDKNSLEKYVKQEIKNGTRSILLLEVDKNFSELGVYAKDVLKDVLAKLKVNRQKTEIIDNDNDDDDDDDDDVRDMKPSIIEKAPLPNRKRRTSKKVEVVASSSEDEDVPEDVDVGDDSEDEFVVDEDDEQDEDEGDGHNEVVSDSEEEKPKKRAARTKPATPSIKKTPPVRRDRGKATSGTSRTSTRRSKENVRKNGGKSALLDSILSI
ncbi:meiotic recombination [Scheffersomyces spartinae]|uniref:Double-strand break repair protein n=1 Tax=Scheffersomyces spartinae TaxID=45513 RepID=A0A9P7V748_9ASCO|nr:meiotic recombination [Scheffersomyces spartinae]KAG7192609.1 meiotic recombination [Scheffersomyces spartinae]